MTKKDKKEDNPNIGGVSEQDSLNDINSGEELAETSDEQNEKSPEDLLKDLEDQLLRAKAEVQNVRRIAAQEVTRARPFHSLNSGPL